MFYFYLPVYLWIFIHSLMIAMLLASPSPSPSTTSKQQTTKTNMKITSNYQLTYNNVTNNLDSWENDLAIMFYAPWCKYCKQLSTSWEQIAMIFHSSRLSGKTNKLFVGVFNCELNTKHAELCSDIGVDRYPAVYYISYGTMYPSHSSNKMKKFPKDVRDRISQFNADIYPEALYEWINMLYMIGSIHRKWDDFKGFFTGNSRLSLENTKLQNQIQSMQTKLQSYTKDLEKYKADELFDSLSDLGDPYPLLHELQPDKNNLPLRVCVGEMGSEYCKYHQDDDPECKYAEACLSNNLELDVCRPKECPYHKRGCVVVSTCMDKDIIKEYQDTLKLKK